MNEQKIENNSKNMHGHKFDDNLVELYSVSRLLAVGGVLLLHDAWMPSVQKTRDFISTNLRNLAQFNITRPRRPGRSASALSAPTTIVAFVKLRGDRREWDHYAAF